VIDIEKVVEEFLSGLPDSNKPDEIFRDIKAPDFSLFQDKVLVELKTLNPSADDIKLLKYNILRKKHEMQQVYAYGYVRLPKFKNPMIENEYIQKICRPITNEIRQSCGKFPEYMNCKNLEEAEKIWIVIDNSYKNELSLPKNCPKNKTSTHFVSSEIAKYIKRKNIFIDYFLYIQHPDVTILNEYNNWFSAVCLNGYMNCNYAHNTIMGLYESLKYALIENGASGVEDVKFKYFI
jgi:hypothetical protein